MTESSPNESSFGSSRSVHADAETAPIGPPAARTARRVLVLLAAALTLGFAYLFVGAAWSPEGVFGVLVMLGGACAFATAAGRFRTSRKSARFAAGSLAAAAFAAVSLVPPALHWAVIVYETWTIGVLNPEDIRGDTDVVFLNGDPDYDIDFITRMSADDARRAFLQELRAAGFTQIGTEHANGPDGTTVTSDGTIPFSLRCPAELGTGRRTAFVQMTQYADGTLVEFRSGQDPKPDYEKLWHRLLESLP